MSAFPPEPTDPVLAYHRRTAHCFEAYAQGPEALDWDAQPAPFRHFDGAPVFPLPRLGSEAPQSPLGLALGRPFGQWNTPVPVIGDLTSLGALLQMSLGITAWKTFGPDRWAVRANPSSGNLHPLEAYLLLQAWPGLEDGVYHYCPETHSLEQRASIPQDKGRQRKAWIGLSSVMWREAWKYGERAFRYCQLDAGHGMAALAYGAAVLGWRLTENSGVGHATLAKILGIDRSEDFPWRRKAFTEQEEPEVLLELVLPDDKGESNCFSTQVDRIGGARWLGTASCIDRFPLYEWKAVEEVAAATRRPDRVLADDVVALPTAKKLEQMGVATVGRVILCRRSAQRFDPKRIMTRQEFVGILSATIPSFAVPWFTPARPPALNLLLYVHRVEGLEPGIYFFARHAESAQDLLRLWRGRETTQAMDDFLPGLFRLVRADAAQLRRVARSLHCHQDIAANACIALGMVGELDCAVTADPSFYRDIHREAGLIGQVLYLEAEARSFQGTGIGCFFDEPVREVVGLEGTGFRTLYHFTIGGAVEDLRIGLGPAYD